MAEVVYTGITGENGAQGTLLNWIKFWLSRKVPMRSWFTAQVLVQNESAIDSFGNILIE